MDKGYWIKSKPSYSTLSWHEQALAHLVIVENEGAFAALKLFQLRHPLEPTTVLISDETGVAGQYTKILEQMLADDLSVYTDTPQMMTKLKSVLEASLMGTQFYVAGDEGFIWEVLAELAVYGVQDCNVEKELCGTLARSVYCVHCKTINKAVHHDIHECTGCQRSLFVRDHFSKRLGAYMGVMIDAEQPGEIPEKMEVYP